MRIIPLLKSPRPSNKRHWQPSGKSRAFTLVELLVVIAIIGVLVGLLLPAVQAAREAARRISCTNNLRNVALGVLNYHDSFERFPVPASVRPNSNDSVLTDKRLFKNWAIEILPYLEQQSLFDRFQIDDTTRVSDAINEEARGTELSLMLCPSDQGQGNLFQGTSGNWARGNYAMNAYQFWGNSFISKAARGEQDHPVTEFLDQNLGMGGVGGPDMSIAKIQDGTTNTIMLSELRVGLGQSDRRGVWAMGMCGSNYHCRHASLPINSCGGFDDDVYEFSEVIAEVGAETLAAQCMSADPGVNASGQSVVRSQHPGGAHAALVDGSVRFLSDFIETGELSIAGFIGEGANDLDPEVFGVWPRLNVSSDGFLIDSGAL
ncbi:DUF1559 domain-containing protein [Adhaeretor mobilis]|uniref:DUF1559 domain-containing protein n=1 Tax=Adhaeretor mobilis TaxID=1930276 RepID=A0A517MWK6_9BACT|nr:DUF1559 domain-containing protein [Adhaeretor mobilis]QDS99187.1 hypothetical protein HG15A2_24790 [Adhaeretor mobilis]